MTSMLRDTALAAVCLTLIATIQPTTAFAGDQARGAHTHVGSHHIDGASFRAPINYRPNSQTAFVRSKAYNEDDTISYHVPQGLIDYKARSPLLEAARANPPRWRSVVSVERY